MKKMMRFVTVCLLLSKLIARQPDFDTFVQKHEKFYADSAEQQKRREIFLENQLFVDKFNRENSHVQLELGIHGDLTNQEFRDLLGSFANNSQLNASTVDEMHGPVYREVDWKKRGVVSPVQNQGQCGSCWSWATTGAVESLHAIMTGDLVVLSKQQLIDCSTENNGCDGGALDLALQYIQQNGLESDDDYQYLARDSTCRYDASKVRVQISSYGSVPPQQPEKLMRALSNQPVPVALDGGSRIFQFYKTGIIDSTDCGTEVNHATLAVGFGEDQGIPFWLIKNSWGPSWGEGGYFRLKRDPARSEGVCGIHLMPTFYPTAATTHSAFTQ